jgi:RNA polymerase sigma-70 factor (ECF subfamily)
LSALPLYTEEQLVALLRSGSREGFNYLYKSYSGALYGMILRIVPEEETAQDVLQEAFVKIWNNIGQYDSTKGRIYTWMLNISRNSAIDKLRSRGEIMKSKIRRDGDAVDNISQTRKTEQQTDTIGLRSMVSKLRPEYHSIVDLAYYKGYTLDEISKTLDVPLGTVKTRMRAAMQQLRQQFRDKN